MEYISSNTSVLDMQPPHEHEMLMRAHELVGRAQEVTRNDDETLVVNQSLKRSELGYATGSVDVPSTQYALVIGEGEVRLSRYDRFAPEGFYNNNDHRDWKKTEITVDASGEPKGRFEDDEGNNGLFTPERAQKELEGFFGILDSEIARRESGDIALSA